MRFIIAIFFGITCYLVSCNLLSHDVVIDNPSTSKLKVNIDQESFILSPKSILEIKVDDGKHQVSISIDTNSNPIKTWKDLAIHQDGILNICANEYIIQNSYYRNFENMNSKELNNNSIVINGYTYQGNITKIDTSQIFIEKTWDRGLDQELTNIEEVNPLDKKLIKIYRTDEFENDFLRNVR